MNRSNSHSSGIRSRGASSAGLSAMIEPLKNFIPRRDTFLLIAGMRIVIARFVASLKSAITLAPLRSTPARPCCLSRRSGSALQPHVPTSPIEHVTSRELRAQCRFEVRGIAGVRVIAAAAGEGFFFWANAADETESSASADAPPASLRWLCPLTASCKSTIRRGVLPRLGNNRGPGRRNLDRIRATVGCWS